jgi:hypothetical protein
MRVFISYSSADRAFVEDLVKKLNERLVDVWYDKWEVKVGDSIIERINEGLDKADYLIVVLSKNSVKSRWVKLELEAAMIKIIEKGAFILPILLEDCEIPFLLKGRRYANFKDDPKQAFDDLLSVIAPETKLPLEEKDKIIWSILAKIFNSKIQDYSLSPQKKQQKIRDEVSEAYQSLKSKWTLPQHIYELYIDQCLEEKRLLYITEFIEKTPELGTKYPNKKDEIIEFLIKKAIGENIV